LLGRRTIIFGIAPCEQHTGTTGRLELGLQGNIAEETQSPTALARCGKIRLSFRTGAALQGGTQEHRTSPCFSRRCSWVPGAVAALRPRNDGDLGLFQRTALAVSAAPAMREAATAASEARAMPEATTKVMCEAAAHAVSEAVAEIAVRARIVRSVAPVIG
jgi:hypothetical protein